MEPSGVTTASRKMPRAASISLADLRTPIVENIRAILPMGHEKALKHAFYNVIAIIISGIGILAFCTVYCILEPFFKPLFWALLVGSVLHPFKENLSCWSRSWLQHVKQSSYPFGAHVLATPLTLADCLSEQIGKYVCTFWKSIIGGLCLFFVTYILYYNPPIRLALFFQSVITSVFSLFQWFLSWINWQVVLSLNVIYVGHIVYELTNKTGLKADATYIKDRSLNSTLPTSVDENSSELKSPTAEETTNTVISSRQNQTPKILRFLPYLNWTVSFLYFLLQLPYTLLIAFIVFITLGVVSVMRGQQAGTKYTISSISRYAYFLALNMGQVSTQLDSTNSGRLSQILSPRRTKSVKPISPLSPAGESPMNSTDCPGAESTFADDKKLHRSISEGSGHGFYERPKSFEKSGGDDVDQSSPKSMPSPIYNTELDSIEEEESHYLIDSNKFLYGVLCACLIVQVWNRLWLLHLLPIPVGYFGLKRLCRRLGINEYLCRKIKQPLLEFYFDLENPHSQRLFPTPVRLCIKILIEADKKMVSICEAYLDPVMTSLVLIIVVIGTITGLIFAAIQVYGEGDHLVRVSVNLLNTTVSQYPEINKLLPEGWQGIMDSMVGNIYIYGKEYITNMIRDSVAEKNPEKAEQIEHQVIELWDRIYMAWNQTWDNGVLSKPHGAEHTFEWDNLIETGKEMPKLLEISVLTSYAKANVGTIWAIMESLWNILVGNISLVLSSVTATVSLLFGGGTAILNLLLNLVVFFTALFYLLSSTSSTYKPVELFNRYTPGGDPHAKNFANAVEETINGVFTASFKMSAFYGMWTWLIHTLFQVNIVFIPSIFGGLFGAVPILGPYWAAVPAVLELWLIQGRWTKALLMFCAQMAPMSVVDTQIYREIKGGGHPYLTGLAVAGGIFYFGFQGALIGPLVLCCFFVAVKIGNSFFNEGNETDTGGENGTRRLYKSENTTSGSENAGASPSTFTSSSLE